MIRIRHGMTMSIHRHPRTSANIIKHPWTSINMHKPPTSMSWVPEIFERPRIPIFQPTEGWGCYEVRWLCDGWRSRDLHGARGLKAGSHRFRKLLEISDMKLLLVTTVTAIGCKSGKSGPLYEAYSGGYADGPEAITSITSCQIILLGINILESK